MPTSAYYDLLSKTNSTGIITVNYGYARYGTGTDPVRTAAKYAADWVRYSNKTRQYAFKYWEIGNENYGTWETDTNSNPHDPYTYAVRAKDYYLQMKQTTVQGGVDIEPYPKAGRTNPVVDLLIYDLAGSNTVTVDVRDGKPFDDAVPGHYVHGVQWASDSSE